MFKNGNGKLEMFVYNHKDVLDWIGIGMLFLIFLLLGMSCLAKLLYEKFKKRK